MENRQTAPLLYPLLSDFMELNKEYRKRRNEYETKTVKPEMQQSDEEEGWVFDKKLKTKVRFKKLKAFDERLENKFWCLLHRVGYKDMNQGRSFRIRYKRKDGEYDEKQIDVFAKDDETVVIAECKSANVLKKKSLQKDIDSFANVKGGLANSVKRFYGKEYKPRILWLFVTENIIWSSPDKERAKAEKIRIITEREFTYFKQIADHLGPASKYQFLAEFFQGQEIPELKNKIVPAIRGKLGGRPFYCFVTTPKQLLKISFINHRALDDPEGYPTYQRLIQRSRIKQIGGFLKRGGFFPTNFLINFSNKVRFDISQKDDENDIHYGYLYLPDRYKSAWIIDGQHRLYGYSGLDEKLLKQNIMVLAFEQLPREEEANQFVTINHEQKSVPRNLLDDLEGDLKWGSTKPTERIGAISACVIQLLDSDIGEPLYNRVTAQGIRATERTCLTVPEIKDGIRRSGLVGRAIMKKKKYEAGPLSGLNDSETLQRAKHVLNEYFSLIREANPERWEKGRSGYLCTNPGVRGYLSLLSALIEHMESVTKLDSKELTTQELVEQIKEHLEPVLLFVSTASDSDFEALFKVPYGSGGPIQYYYHLCQLVRQSYADFCPDGYEAWEATQSEEQIFWADQRIKELTTSIQSHIFNTFKKLYGVKDNAYWEQGVINKEIKTKAYTKSLDDNIEKRLPIEAYVDLIDLKKIVENRSNWIHFKDVFNIPLPGVKGHAKNLAWMDRLNEIRRIPAHSYQRNYSSTDFEFLEWLYEEFNRRLQQTASLENNEKGDLAKTSVEDVNTSNSKA